MRSRIWFLVLVVLFTLFGGGKGSHWRVVTQDQQGWRYDVDENSVRNLEPALIKCSVRVTREGVTRRDIWLLDAANHTLTLESVGRPEPIRPGSVALDFVRFFKVEGRLPVAGMPFSGPSAALDTRSKK